MSLIVQNGDYSWVSCTLIFKGCRMIKNPFFIAGKKNFNGKYIVT